ITYAYNQTKYIGELRVYVKGDGSIENQLNRYVALDSVIPDDTGAEEVVTAAHTEFTNQQNQAAQASQEAPQKRVSPLLAADSPFVGGETCAACHQKDHDVWANTSH